MNPNGTDDADRSTDREPRCRELSVGDGALVIHDPDNHHAWIHSTVALDPFDHR